MFGRAPDPLPRRAADPRGRSCPAIVAEDAARPRQGAPTVVTTGVSAFRSRALGAGVTASRTPMVTLSARDALSDLPPRGAHARGHSVVDDRVRGGPYSSGRVPLHCAKIRCRVPVWPPADTQSRRDVPVTSALTNVIVGYATSVLVESVRLFGWACNGPHDRVTQRVSQARRGGLRCVECEQDGRSRRVRLADVPDGRQRDVVRARAARRQVGAGSVTPSSHDCARASVVWIYAGRSAHPDLCRPASRRRCRPAG